MSWTPPVDVGAPDPQTDAMQIEHPPRGRLALAGILAVVSIACLLSATFGAFSATAPAIAGYLLGYGFATFGGLGATAAFTRTDNQRSQSRFYSPDRRLGPLRTAIIVTCVGSAAANVWQFAYLVS